MLADVYCDMAIIYEENGFSENAIKYYKMAIQLQQPTTHYNACLNLANILYNLNINLDDALMHYEKALEFDNTSVYIYMHMGNIYTELNKNKDALRCFNMAIQHDPQCLEAYINVGSIQKDNNNFIEAIRTYEFVLKLQPDHPHAYCNLVNCLQKVCDWSDYDARVKKLKEIVKKQLNDGDVLSLLPHDALMFPLSLKLLKNIASNFSKQCVEKLGKSQFTHPSPPLNVNIKIGFVLTNFAKHPITTIMETITSICKNHKVHVICYSMENDNIPSW